MKQEKSENTVKDVDLQGISVLLVEDEEINAELAAAILTDLGIRVTIACNGSEAVARFKDAVFDLVLMDVMMPVKNGYQCTSEIRQFERQQGRSHTPIIAMTALCDPTELEKCLKSGMDGHTSKPIDWNILVNEIELVLAEKKSENKEPGRSNGLDYNKFLCEMCNKNEGLAARLIDKFIRERGPK